MSWGIRLFRRDAYVLHLENELSRVSRERDYAVQASVDAAAERAAVEAEIEEIDEAIAVLRTYREKWAVQS